MHDSAEYRRVELIHGIQHAAIVETVCAGLHELEALKAEAPRDWEVLRERCRGRLVAQVGGDVRIFVRRPENMEMRVAGVARRHVCGVKTDIGVWLRGGHRSLLISSVALPALHTAGGWD